MPRRFWLLALVLGACPSLFAQTPTLPVGPPKPGWQYACPSGLGAVRTQLAATASNLYIDQLCVDSTGGSDGGVPGTEYHFDPIAVDYTIIHFSSGSGAQICPGLLPTNLAIKTVTPSTLCTSTIFDDGSNPTRTPNGLSTELNGLYGVWTVDTGGVTAGLLACRSSGTKVQTCAAGTTFGVIGIAQSTQTSGSIVRVCTTVHCPAVEDGTTANDWLIPSPTVAGQVHDSGVAITSPCPDNVQAFYPDPTGTGAGTTIGIDLSTADSSCQSNGGSGGGNGIIHPAAQFSTAYYFAPGVGKTIDGVAPNTSAIPEVFEQVNGTIQQWMPLGVALDSSTSTSVTLTCADFGRHKYYTAVGAVSISLPKANSCASPAQPNAIILISAAGAGGATITPTTSTIGIVGGTQGASITIVQGISAFIYTDTSTAACVANGCYDAITAASGGATVTMSVPVELLVNGSSSATGSNFAVTKAGEVPLEAWLSPPSSALGNMPHHNSAACATSTACNVTVQITANTDGIVLTTDPDAAPGTVTITDTFGNTFTAVGSFFYVVCSSLGNGNDTIHLASTNSVGWVMSASDVVGNATASCVDSAITNSSSSLSVTSAGSPAQGSELILAQFNNIGSLGTGLGVYEAGTNYTQVEQVNCNVPNCARIGQILEVKNQNTSLSGTQTATATRIGGGITDSGNIIGIKLSAASINGPPFFNPITMNYLPVATLTPTQNDCVSWLVQTGSQPLVFNDSGFPCPAATVNGGGVTGQVAYYSAPTAISPSGALTISGIGSPGMILLEEHTASASAEVDFTTCITATYTEYQIFVDNAIPTTNADSILMQFSTNGGSTYDTGANYNWSMHWTGSAASSDNSLFVNPDNQINLNGTTVTVSNLAANGGVQSRITLFNPGSATADKGVLYNTRAAFSGSTNWYQITAQGTYAITTAVNAFRFKPTGSNTIASGSFRCYGMAK